LSDEAVAAFADGVLRGHAHERARRHTAECDECARAVRVQREAVLALRTAPAPPLPTGLLDRLRSVPVTTPLSTPATTLPAALDRDGSAMFETIGPLPTAAAFVAPKTQRRRRGGPAALTVAAVAAAGVLAASSAAGATAGAQHGPSHQPPTQQSPVRFAPVSFRQP
jgi:hypothetical protein